MGKNEKHGQVKCWEFKKCERQPGGSKVRELGVCPAATTDNGRFCWYVAGTLCGGELQGTFAHKEESCLLCDFLRMVRREEGADFSLFDLNKR